MDLKSEIESTMKKYGLLSLYVAIRSVIISKKDQIAKIFDRFTRNYERTGSLDKFLASNDDVESELEAMTADELRDIKYMHSYKGNSYLHNPYKGRDPTIH